MKASIVDLRYKMNEVLAALDRNESVKVLYHGKLKAVLTPATQLKTTRKIQDHPAFGMYKNDKMSVDEVMKKLRGERYRDL